MNEIEKKKYGLSSIRYRLLFLICLSIFPAFIFTFIVADQFLIQSKLKEIYDLLFKEEIPSTTLNEKLISILKELKN